MATMCDECQEFVTHDTIIAEEGTVIEKVLCPECISGLFSRCFPEIPIMACSAGILVKCEKEKPASYSIALGVRALCLKQ